MRWAAAVWLAVWLPAYAAVWGWANFLHLCDIAVVLTCVGLWRGSSLLLSSQAVASTVVDLVWTIDVAWRLLFGKHLVGGTEYMWDPRFPLWVRLLSVFHLFWPVLLLWALRHVGYDRRGWVLQSAIAAALLVLARFAAPARNINFAYRDPLFRRAWGPAPVHLAVILLGLVALIYWPTHLVLGRLLPRSACGSRPSLCSPPPRSPSEGLRL
jgi:hypothetical protein